MGETWTPRTWRGKPARQMPVYTDEAALAAAEKNLATWPPLVFAGEARNLKADLARVARGEAFPAPGRRLRGELRRVPRQQYPRHLQGAAADGGGADLRRILPGGEGRAHGRPVRQAALGPDRDRGRGGAAELPGRHHQRHGLRRALARARPAADAPGLHPVLGDAEPAPRLRHGRLRRPASGPPLEPRLRARGTGRAIPRHGGPALRSAGVHRGHAA